AAQAKGCPARAQAESRSAPHHAIIARLGGSRRALGAARGLATERIVRPACEGPRMDGPTFQLSQGDAVAWLRARPAESIDLLITDPPYESLEKHRAIGTTPRLKHSKASSNDWFSIFP